MISREIKVTMRRPQNFENYTAINHDKIYNEYILIISVHNSFKSAFNDICV